MTLDNLYSKANKVIVATISYEDYISIDLSVKNPDLTFDLESSSVWETYINSYLKKHNKKVAYGGYLEKRALYDRSSYFNESNDELKRNIHLGLDLWISAGTPVLAAFDGEIHSFKNNTNFGDYGPTIILKHTINDLSFYSLYGHLRLNDLKSLKVGDLVKKGETIAHLGEAKENGDYAPHLHFQIIKDIEDNFGDYPGVSNKKDIEFYKSNCPDPKLFLGL